MDEQKVLDQNYSQSLDSLRHYSSLLVQVRTVALAQGFTVLAAAGFLYREGEKGNAIFVSFFGIAMTIVLWTISDNYLKYFEATQRHLISLEDLLGNPHGLCRTVEEERNIRLRGLYRLAIVHGPFLVMVVGAVALMIASI